MEVGVECWSRLQLVFDYDRYMVSASQFSSHGVAGGVSPPWPWPNCPSPQLNDPPHLQPLDDERPVVEELTPIYFTSYWRNCVDQNEPQALNITFPATQKSEENIF